MTKKRIKRIAAVALACCSIFASACNNGGDTSSSQEDLQTINRKYSLVKQGGASDYIILIPEHFESTELEGAGWLQSYINSATFCKLPIVTEDAFTGNAANSKIISIGETNVYKASGLAIDRQSLNGDGFAVKNVGDDIFCVGGTKRNGHLYSVQGLLTELLDWEAYAVDEVYYKKSTTLSFDDMNIVEVPDIRDRDMYNKLIRNDSEYQKLLRHDKSITTLYGFAHTIFKWLPPDVYYEGHEAWYPNTDPDYGVVCFSQQDMLEELARVVIEDIKGDPNAEYVMIGQMDGNDWCTCTVCSETASYYGAKSATLIKAINYVADQVQEYLVSSGQADRELYVSTFAYCASEAPPTKHLEDMKLRPNVAIRMALIRADYSRAFEDETNIGEYTNVLAWAKLCDNLCVWAYNKLCNDFFVPFCSFNAVQDQYRFYKQNGVTSLMEESHSASYSSGFQALKTYTMLKLMWDVDADYEQLLDDFFDNYYKDGSTYMRKYFDDFRQWYNIIEEKYIAINCDTFARYEMVADVFPLHMISRWEGYVEQAKKEIEYLRDFNVELYNKLYLRMDIETLFFDWVRLNWYKTNYPDETLRKMRLDFKEKCTLHNVTHYTLVNGTMESLYAKWGI